MLHHSALEHNILFVTNLIRGGQIMRDIQKVILILIPHLPHNIKGGFKSQVQKVQRDAA